MATTVADDRAATISVPSTAVAHGSDGSDGAHGSDGSDGSDGAHGSDGRS
ncbi:MAG: hypothetical protein JWN95_4158 [Frankiales bacterium]|nr:hypothetical protein [Frankiales bacterium]